MTWIIKHTKLKNLGQHFILSRLVRQQYQPVLQFGCVRVIDFVKALYYDPTTVFQLSPKEILQLLFLAIFLHSDPRAESHFSLSNRFLKLWQLANSIIINIAEGVLRLLEHQL